MTAYHYGQIVLALGVLALVGKRVHEVFFEAGRFDKRLGEAILASLRAGETARARALAAGGGEAWEARIGRAAFDAYDRGVDVGATVEEVMGDVRYSASAGLRSLRVLASIASASGLMGACIEYVWLMTGDHGLAGLMAGRPQELATTRAILSVAIGFSVMIVALSARTQLGREGRALLARAKKTARALDRWGQRRQAPSEADADAVPRNGSNDEEASDDGADAGA